MSSDEKLDEAGNGSGCDANDEKIEPEISTEKNESSVEIARIQLTEAQLDSASLEELRLYWKKQDTYINVLESRTSNLEGEITTFKDNEEKLKNQLAELGIRERAFMRRLAAKEQDMQEYAGQMSEMKVQGGSLKSTLVDPAVNLLIQKLRQELSETRTKLEDTQNELAAWKFTPDSNTGKRLMAKCRLLYQENEELGAMISKGRLAKLEGDLALQKSFSEEVKKSQSELDELLQDLDEDVEGMQSTIYYLQLELRKSKDSIQNLEQEISTLREKSAPVNGLNTVHSWRASNDSLDSQDASRTKEGDSVVNNIDGPRKRTSSEISDENTVIKKTRSDSQLSVHYSDEEVVTNGENGD